MRRCNSTSTQHNLLIYLPRPRTLNAGAPIASIEELAAWVAQLLDAARVQEAGRWTAAWTSLVAFKAVARHPQWVARIALPLGAAVLISVSDALLDAAHNDRAKAEAMVNV